MVVASPEVSACSGVMAAMDEVMTMRRMEGYLRAEVRMLVVPAMAGWMMSRSRSSLCRTNVR